METAEHHQQLQPLRSTTAATAASSTSTSDDQLKFALAVTVAKQLIQKQQHHQPPPPDSDALRWKRKAKDRKEEICRLREDLKEAEDAMQCDLLAQTASCKCYFFDNMGKLSPNRDGDRFNDVLRRRFLRLVRLRERRRRRRSTTDGCNQRRRFSEGKMSKLNMSSSLLNLAKNAIAEFNCEDEAEQLRASVDFLLELCENSSVEEANFANWSHQAVDFILASVRSLALAQKNMEAIEGIVNSLIVGLVRRMCSPSHGDVSQSHHIDTDAQFCVQHVIRKLGTEPYIGQHAILAVSRSISVVAENLLFLDPFDAAFPNMHRCVFIMIQLIEFLVLDYLLIWSENASFDNVLFEEWVTSVLHARKALELLESRNGLYVLYMDRVTGELAKLVGQNSSLQKINRDIVNNLFH